VNFFFDRSLEEPEKIIIPELPLPEKIIIPELPLLVNFPQFCNEETSENHSRHCVMCGTERTCFKKRRDSDGKTPFIPLGGKGVCTSCEAVV
jgi:hypothetical protein